MTTVLTLYICLLSLLLIAIIGQVEISKTNAYAIIVTRENKIKVIKTRQ